MQYNNFDMNLLRTLDALLAERSVTRAAERLCISQPAMSGALQRLRDHFKDQLLIRMGRDMVLTPLGESLLGPVRETLLQFQSTLATRPSFDPTVTRRNFNIAMSDYGAFVLMPPLLRRLGLEAPLTACRVEPISGETFGRMETGDLDLLVTVESCEVALRHQESARDLKMRRLFHDEFVCVVDENHPDIGDVMTLDNYKALPHILVRFGPYLDTLVEQTWKLAELDMNIAATAPSFASMLFMLPGTPMIATVQRRIAQALAPSLRLKVLECPVKIKTLQQILMWHPRSDFDPGHQYLRHLFVEAARARSDEGDAQFEQSPIQAPPQEARGLGSVLI
jgi:DNA-binding transcriptional LysR family regulator